MDHRAAVAPSLNFLLVLALFTGIGALLWHGLAGGKLAVLLFVVAGWIVSLCLHEFGHALTAYLGGDHVVARTGYLTLDPLKYTDPLLSLILPVLYLFLGGFGLPGGAVYIRHGALRSRGWDSATSAAGPFANLVVLALLAALLAVAPSAEDGDISDIQAGLGVLAYFQATAIVLNLIPLPGLDGFGIVRPFLPTRVAALTTQVGTAAFLILVVLLWVTPLGSWVSSLALDLTGAFSIPIGPIARGFSTIRG